MTITKFIFGICYIIVLFFSLYGLFDFEKAVKIAYKFYNHYNLDNRPFLFSDSYLRIILKASLIIGIFMGIVVTVYFIASLLGSSLQEIISN